MPRLRCAGCTAIQFNAVTMLATEKIALCESTGDCSTHHNEAASSNSLAACTLDSRLTRKSSGPLPLATMVPSSQEFLQQTDCIVR